MGPTLREPDGLAMSSRNTLLSSEERKQAPFLYQMLQKAASLLGERQTAESVKTQIMDAFHANGNFAVDYFDICSAVDLQPISNGAKDKPLILLVAAKLGNVRLIDNVLLQ
jgi:pantoate--beta-alanine ligase